MSVVTFAPDARPYVDWALRTLQAHADFPGTPPALQSALSKMRGQVGRVALLFHLIELAAARVRAGEAASPFNEDGSTLPPGAMRELDALPRPFTNARVRERDMIVASQRRAFAEALGVEIIRPGREPFLEGPSNVLAGPGRSAREDASDTPLKDHQEPVALRLSTGRAGCRQPPPERATEHAR